MRREAVVVVVLVVVVRLELSTFTITEITQQGPATRVLKRQIS